MTLDAQSRPPSPLRRGFALPAPALLALYGAALIAPLAAVALSAARRQGFWREFSTGAGLVAFALLAMQFVLSGRLRTLSGRVGIDLTMRWHQLAARSLGVLVVLHPLLYAASSRLAPGLQPLTTAMHRLVALLTLRAYASGVAGWLIVLALIAAGLLRHRIAVRYEVWRVTHAVGGVLAVLLIAHHAFHVGLYANDPAVRICWILLLLVATGMFAFIYIVKPLMLSRSPYRIRGNLAVADGIREIILEPVRETRVGFAAGQFAWFSLGRWPWPGLDHPFSIASSPAELPTVRLLVKESGDFTRTIGDLPLDAPAYIDGPHGNFTLAGRTWDSLCLVAGGIGIAPGARLLRELHARRERRPIALIFAARTAHDLVFRDEIERMTDVLDLHVTCTVEQRTDGWQGAVGMPDLATIRSAARCRQPRRCLALLCGPTPMMLAAERHLAEIGIPRHRIVYERFGYD